MHDDHSTSWPRALILWGLAWLAATLGAIVLGWAVRKVSRG